MINLFKLCLATAFLFTVSILLNPISASSMGAKKPSNFDIAMKTVYLHECGYSDDKNDSGGPTKFGLSLRFLKLENLDIDGDGDVDKDDVLKLTKSDADKIYLQKFWTNNHYEKIKSYRVATKVFDISVNAGASRSHKLVRMSINKILHANIPVTGTLDDETINTMNRIEPVLLLDEIRSQQAMFYRSIVNTHPQYKVFLKGWLARAKD
jgi:lysozyme family protein